MSRRTIIGLLAGVVLVLSLAPAALADGDPASDWLLAGATFLSPYDGKIPAADQEKIKAMLASAQKQGLPLKLAVIATSYDLGSVPVLFDKPQTYAKFLGLEDFYYWKDELLVVMPNGYGIYKAKDLPPGDKAAIKHLALPASKSGPDLAAATEKALDAIAARHGITLSTTGGSSGGSSAWTERGEIAGGAVVLCAIGFGAWWLLRRRSA
jgi:hypothetical protein